MKIRSLTSLRLFAAALLVAGLSAAHTASAGFASTTVSPTFDTVNVGDTFSVDILFTINGNVGGFATNGYDTTLNFDASILEILSITNGAGSPFSMTSSSFNNVSGSAYYAASGPSLLGGTYTLATVLFGAIGPGTSIIDINPRQLLAGYGYFGINGSATDGSVLVTGSAPSVPDASSSLLLVGGALIGLLSLRRRFGRA